MWQRFTERARRVILEAQQEASLKNSPYVGTEHLLLGLVREEESAAVQILQKLSATPERVREEIEKAITPWEGESSSEAKLTPGAKRTLEMAADEARRLRHNYIGTEHLLLALLRAKEDIAVRALHKLGINLEDTRQEVIEYQGPGDPKVQSHQPAPSSKPAPHPCLPIIQSLIVTLDESIAAISENDSERLGEIKQTLMTLHDDLRNQAQQNEESDE